jgi:glycerophosphoryl diester phosphodiesterase
VGELTLAALRARIPGLPTLEEMLDRLGSSIAFNLELKCHPDADYPDLPERALDEVRKRDLLSQSLFSCFFDPALARVRELEPRARVGLLVSRRSNVKILERAERLGAEAVHPELAITTRELVDELHGAGYRVNVFTVDGEDDQRRLVDWGVDGIFTNVPGRLRQLLANG